MGSTYIKRFSVVYLKFIFNWAAYILHGNPTYDPFWSKVKVKSLSRVPLFATPWTVAYQAPQSMGFSRQEYWSGLPFSGHYTFSLLWRQLLPGCYHCSSVWLAFEICVSGNVWFLFFCGWLFFKLSIMFVRFVHVSVCRDSLYVLLL